MTPATAMRSRVMIEALGSAGPAGKVQAIFDLPLSSLLGVLVLQSAATISKSDSGLLWVCTSWLRGCTADRAWFYKARASGPPGPHVKFRVPEHFGPVLVEHHGDAAAHVPALEVSLQMAATWLLQCCRPESFEAVGALGAQNARGDLVVASTDDSSDNCVHPKHGYRNPRGLPAVKLRSDQNLFQVQAVAPEVPHPAVQISFEILRTATSCAKGADGLHRLGCRPIRHG